MKKKVTKADLASRTGKYLIARHKGLNKVESAIVAGYGETMGRHNANKIEGSQIYKALEKKYFADELTEQITLQEIGAELVKNIKQDLNLGAKNTAIEIALSKLEPEDNHLNDNDERVLVILK